MTAGSGGAPAGGTPTASPVEDVPPLQVLLGVLAAPHRQQLVRTLEHEQLTQR